VAPEHRRKHGAANSCARHHSQKAAGKSRGISSVHFYRQAWGVAIPYGTAEATGLGAGRIATNAEHGLSRHRAGGPRFAFVLTRARMALVGSG